MFATFWLCPEATQGDKEGVINRADIMEVVNDHIKEGRKQIPAIRLKLKIGGPEGYDMDKILSYNETLNFIEEEFKETELDWQFKEIKDWREFRDNCGTLFYYHYNNCRRAAVSLA